MTTPIEALRELIAAADESVSSDDDVKAMIRYGKADANARAALADHEAQQQTQIAQLGDVVCHVSTCQLPECRSSGACQRAQQQEPVAWLYTKASTNQFACVVKRMDSTLPGADEWKETPLYTHPPQDATRRITQDEIVGLAAPYRTGYPERWLFVNVLELEAFVRAAMEAKRGA